MAPLVTTLAELKSRARTAADMVNSSFITDAELTAWANEAQNELFDLLVRTHEDYFEKTGSPLITTVAGTEDYALPTDFYKLLSVDVQLSTSGDWYSLRPYHPAQRNDYTSRRLFSRPSYHLSGYRIVGENIRLKPTPQGGDVVRVRYVKRPEELITTTNENLEHALLSHWSEHMVYSMAIKMLLKEESDVSELKALKADIERKIERNAKDRDESFPMRIADVRAGDSFDDIDWPEWP